MLDYVIKLLTVLKILDLLSVKKEKWQSIFLKTTKNC